MVRAGGGKGVGQRLGDEALRAQVHAHAQQVANGAGRCVADGRDIYARERAGVGAYFQQALAGEAHAVGAGEDDPVVVADLLEGLVGSRELVGAMQFNRGRFDDPRAHP